MRSWSSPSVPQLPGEPPALGLRPRHTQSHVPNLEGPTRRLYVCGITPYDATHLGHAATYVAFDLLVRHWRDADLDVVYVQNVTDIDDPLLERAAADGIDWQQLAADQTDLFRADMEALRVIAPDHYVAVTDTISEVATAVAGMLERGAAYWVPNDDVTADDVYADLSADRFFGDSSNLEYDTQLELFGERGGDPDRSGKIDRLDPLLWRAARPGEPCWDGGVLGAGRPGWHVECSVIAHSYLGAIDVQGGGSDLVFPHHEMSESHLRMMNDGDHPIGVSVHAGMVAYQGEKMSKSLGNLELVSRLRQRGVDPTVIRLALLSHHYADDWEYTDSDIDRASQRLSQWRQAVASGRPAGDVIEKIRTHLANDLDAPAALDAIDTWAGPSTQLAAGAAQAGSAQVAEAIDALLGVKVS